jgi:hypothetical protein
MTDPCPTCALLRRDLADAFSRLAAASEVLSRAAERTGFDCGYLAEIVETVRAENDALRAALLDLMALSDSAAYAHKVWPNSGHCLKSCGRCAWEARRDALRARVKELEGGK